MRRIIPARAGFTIVDYLVENRERDHPRSRGVYYATYTGSSVACGSSPLARGLPSSPPGAPSSEGIIPARAGFTPGYASGGVLPGDHPRSRGVYDPGDRPDPVRTGSSPLARGLPSQYNPVSLGTKDHPRSRGVYHMRVRRQMRRGGIIPARAGFTQHCT